MADSYLTYAYNHLLWGYPRKGKKYFDKNGEFSEIEFTTSFPTNQEEFNMLTWSEISDFSQKFSNGKERYFIGDSFNYPEYENLLGCYKEDNLDGVGPIRCTLIGLLQDVESYTRNPVGFTFQITSGVSSTVPASFKMNSAANTTGGWRDSYMRSTNVPLFKSALSSDLQAVLKTVEKYSYIPTSEQGAESTNDELFPLSMIELYGDTKDLITDNPVAIGNLLAFEGEQYLYFYKNATTSANAKSIHVIKNNSGGAAVACTRSPHLTNTRNYYQIGSNGGWTAGMATTSTLPAFGFCV